MSSGISEHLSGFVPTASVIAVHCLLRLNFEMHHWDGNCRVPSLHQRITKLFVNLGALTQNVSLLVVSTLMLKPRWPGLIAVAPCRAMSTDILHFPARVLVIRAARAVTGSDSDPGHGPPIYSRDVRSSVLSASPPDVVAGDPVPWSERQSAFHGHADASTNRHVSHDANRLASTRVRRAGAERDRRSAATASPVPKYISSGVCP